MEQKLLTIKVERPELDQDVVPSIQFYCVTRQGDICCEEEIKTEQDRAGNSGMYDYERLAHVTFDSIKTAPHSHGDSIDCPQEAYSVGVIKREPQESLKADGDFDVQPSSSDLTVNTSPFPVSLYRHLNTSTWEVSTNDGIKSDPEAVGEYDKNVISPGTVTVSNLNVESNQSTISSDTPDRITLVESRPQGNRLRCTFCVYKCTDVALLVQHLKTHIDEKPNTCELCDYRSTDMAVLALHMKTHIEEPNTCELCGYRCLLLSDMTAHRRMHFLKNPYSCLYCSYQCEVLLNLKIHERIHTGEKQYKCSMCPYDADTDGQVTLHARIHSGAKPFKCSVCSYTASRKGQITTHERTHTVEKPHKCPACPYSASQKTHLEIHRRTRHGKKKTYSSQNVDCPSFRHISSLK